MSVKIFAEISISTAELPLSKGTTIHRLGHAGNDRRAPKKLEGVEGTRKGDDVRKSTAILPSGRCEYIKDLGTFTS